MSIEREESPATFEPITNQSTLTRKAVGCHINCPAITTGYIPHSPCSVSPLFPSLFGSTVALLPHRTDPTLPWRGLRTQIHTIYASISLCMNIYGLAALGNGNNTRYAHTMRRANVLRTLRSVPVYKLISDYFAYIFIYII